MYLNFVLRLITSTLLAFNGHVFIFITMLANGVYITTKFSDQCYDLGVKSQYLINLKSILPLVTRTTLKLFN